jgi:hypothetical protein
LCGKLSPANTTGNRAVNPTAASVFSVWAAGLFVITANFRSANPSRVSRTPG